MTDNKALIARLRDKYQCGEEDCRAAAAALEHAEARIAVLSELYAREGRKAMVEAERRSTAEARVKELERINADHCRAVNTLNLDGAKLENKLTAAEARVKELEKFIRGVADGFYAARDAPRILDEFIIEARRIERTALSTAPKHGDE